MKFSARVGNEVTWFQLQLVRIEEVNIHKIAIHNIVLFHRKVDVTGSTAEKGGELLWSSSHTLDIRNGH